MYITIFLIIIPAVLLIALMIMQSFALSRAESAFKKAYPEKYEELFSKSKLPSWMTFSKGVNPSTYRNRLGIQFLTSRQSLEYGDKDFLIKRKTFVRTWFGLIALIILWFVVILIIGMINPSYLNRPL